MSGVVWVLGAGFSKALGGPLLPALLSKQSQSRLLAAYPDLERLHNSRGTAIVRGLLREHGWERPDRASHAWQDAEEFLEALDLAAESPASSQVRKHLAALSPLAIEEQSYPEASAAAKHIVAAECSAFLKEADTRAEKWKPYVAWARSLEKDDAVITFNYDRVVELALTAANKDARIAGIELPVPTVGPMLVKLHGSVDWRLGPNGNLQLIEKPDFAVDCADGELAIASPGPTKARLAAAWTSLWEVAKRAILEARAVVFVGYRFPPSDSVARERLLSAIREAKDAHLSVHTVLGPDTGAAESRRLVGLLRYALQRAGRGEFPGGHLPRQSPPTFFTLRPQPLYGEDFIGLVERASIIDPHMDERRR